MKNFVLLEEACDRNDLHGPVITWGSPTKYLEDTQFSVCVSCGPVSRSVAKKDSYPATEAIDELARLVFQDLQLSGHFKLA